VQFIVQRWVGVDQRRTSLERRAFNTHQTICVEQREIVCHHDGEGFLTYGDFLRRASGFAAE
jgi:hypothetical protein